VRLALLHRDLTGLLGALRPDAAAVESAFHGKNSRSALRLAQARGVILAALAEAGVRVHEYTPATVKSAVTGNGRAPKEQVLGMVQRLLAAPSRIAGSHDVSDALAVALCHAAASGPMAALARTAGPARRSVPRGHGRRSTRAGVPEA
jgi:crossover junction endodeoxyribonuclease RuvC